MRLIIAGFVVGVAACLAVVVGLALVTWADDFEQGWESDHYHESPTADPPDAHQGDGPP